MSIDTLTEKILSNRRNEGVTFSGGEPFWQAPTLAKLARRVKAAGLNVMSFSGFTLEQLRSPYAPAGAAELLAQLDLLIDGAYVESLAVHSPDSLVSSSNQRVHVFNPAMSRSAHLCKQPDRDSRSQGRQPHRHRISGTDEPGRVNSQFTASLQVRQIRFL